MGDLSNRGRVAAVLGPTNTGKTHYAIERMLAHRTGVIGLPLRLLAREVYDRIVAIRGPSVVALVTGEERIVPPRAVYWVCTVEAMPTASGADFLAVDEIQLCADPERGHVFTNRLLHARGLHETLFMGADTMRNAIAELIPHCEFMHRERFSQLVYAGSKKISRMPGRSAIVGFSVENLYATAELVRRQKGGAAVVMGALSPRTRNAQVEMYQNGDVDVLVATDAIGMGLNLDIKHVAFSGLRKFDGRKMRDLWPNELAQIAGRAGRHTQDGSFGVTGEAPMLDDGVVEAIENHRFAPVRKLMWRNADLEFGSAERLITSLERPTDDEWLSRAREADDVQALKALMARPEIAARLGDARTVRLLWDVCNIPDFRGISQAEHADLLGLIFGFVHETRHVPDDWLASQIKRIDRPEGDIDTLSKRLAYIRTWTYVAQRNGWVDDESHWRGVTRAVEDRLSDALHDALTLRFVDRRTSVLLRRLKQRESLVAEVNDQGEVSIEGQVLGRIEGFRFRQDKTASADEAKTLQQAAMAALRPEFHLRADRMYNAPDPEFDLTEQGGLMWGDMAVGKLVKGAEPLRPVAEAFVDEDAGAEVIQKVQRRLQHFIDRRIAAQFEPLLALSRDEAVTGLARGVAFQLLEGFGIVPRAEIADDVKALDQDARSLLRKHGVRFGQFTIFQPLLLKPAPTRLRLLLWGLDQGFDTFPDSPPPGLVTIPSVPDAPKGHATMTGYREAGTRAIRVDMLERLADMLRGENSRAGFEANADMLSISGLTLEQFADLMGGLGYKGEKGERVKVKATPAPVAKTDAPVEVAAEEAPAAEGTAEDTPVVDAPAQETPEVEARNEDTLSEDAPSEDAPSDVAPVEATPADVAESTTEATTEATAEAEPTPEPAAKAAPEMEVFYTFTWASRGRGNARPRRADGAQGGKRADGAQGGKRADGGSEGKRSSGKRSPGKQRGQGKGGNRPPRDDKPKVYSAQPEKTGKIDPDNPFAALAALKVKS